MLCGKRFPINMMNFLPWLSGSNKNEQERKDGWRVLKRHFKVVQYSHILSWFLIVINKRFFSRHFVSKKIFVLFPFLPDTICLFLYFQWNKMIVCFWYKEDSFPPSNMSSIQLKSKKKLTVTCELELKSTQHLGR